MTPFDTRQADARYKPFPAFAEWSRCVIDTERWDRYSESLALRSGISAEHLLRAREVIKRAAAMDTGAIEGLYETDRGFTFTIAEMATNWEALLDSKGPVVRRFYFSQLKAYDSLVDLATQSEPISEAAMRALHELVCEAQDTYKAVTEIGLQELRLPKGEYKHLPNHVIGRDGQPHSYAPVDLTPTEMHRLCQELRGEVFVHAHPVLQASYAHYALVLIHPFADGNGRVARALASVFTIRSHSIPLLILNENREQYVNALQAADQGNYQAFTDFMFER
ncbi:MAG: Fic family protein, partial [Blastocatellia bacterium]